MHAPQCHLWPVWLYNIFQPYLLNGTIFGKKKLLNIKCGFSISLLRSSEIFLILRRNEQHMIKNLYWLSCKISITLVRFQ